jgi:hypothetical protein
MSDALSELQMENNIPCFYTSSISHENTSSPGPRLPLVGLLIRMPGKSNPRTKAVTNEDKHTANVQLEEDAHRLAQDRKRHDNRKLEIEVLASPSLHMFTSLSPGTARFYFLQLSFASAPLCLHLHFDLCAPSHAPSFFHFRQFHQQLTEHSWNSKHRRYWPLGQIRSHGSRT